MMSFPQGGDRPFFQKGKRPVEVIAHRGGGGEWPGETVYAFQQAITTGVDILEMDVHRTRDGALVLMHNETVDETTDGTGSIKDLDLSYIRTLDAANTWPSLKGGDIRVAELEDVFDRFPHVRMNIEIKQKEPSLVPDLCKLITRKGREDEVLIACGWKHVLAEFREACPQVATSASVTEIAEVELDALVGTHFRPDTDAVQWRSKEIIEFITTDFVKKARELNLKVHGWTVNEHEEMVRLIDLGVDGIITDYPTALLALLGS
jgi:glycerophosphoryl diester phosphodiesterase